MHRAFTLTMVIKQRARTGDKEAFEDAEDDGVVLRTEPLPDDLIEELTIKLSPEDVEGYKELAEEAQIMRDQEPDLPFATHLSNSDAEGIRKLRELNESNNL